MKRKALHTIPLYCVRRADGTCFSVRPRGVFSFIFFPKGSESMAKTGLFGFGYINESIFYSKLSDLLGRDVTAQDKQLIHNTVQRQLEDGCLEYYACDGQGTVSGSSSAPRSAKAILA